ncbi:mechanosensitive ion channel domain-containing protein [Edaphobacter bradus]|uniref:mechanosensitive ion channel domain-containing protein n=1 Tax=Edaphobacter bradus TaxID=2259016 RepID=UPI0021E01349|nr:mechanosensitive ion channel domain-containing protein [Edaphobacter bradus]
MRDLRRLFVVVPVAVLVACVVGIILTQGSMAHLSFLKGKHTAGELVDQRPWQTAQAMAAMAVSAEEQEYARQALRLADHEVDQAFAQAMRQATVDTRTLTGDALAQQQKVARLESLVKEDQAKVDQLTAAAKGAPAGTENDDLDLAKAQAQLDSDELTDAKGDLAKASGDKSAQIKEELSAREAEMKKYDAQMGDTTQTAVVSAKRYGTLMGRIGAWLAQRTRMEALRQAKAQADADAAALTLQHSEIDKKLNAPGSADAAQTSAKSRVACLKQMREMVTIQGILDDRIQAHQQLSQVYGQWLNQVKLQHTIVVHMILVSLAWIASLVLLGAIAGMIANKLLDRLRVDRRSQNTLRNVVGLGVHVVTLVLVLLVIFGTPSQMPTILGLATAGLTVVFQDFILAFFGWFVLMGKSGIRVEDWVEINGVRGEVVEVGLFRTTLLETGNWTAQGHPTGRRVTFMNSFAVRGQYFNFSTSGQWMWDEIKVNIPRGAETYKLIESIHGAVAKETEENAKQAEREWQRATKQGGLSQFSAEPSVELQPASSGVDMVVRYVTRAGERFDVRNRLYQRVIDLMGEAEDAGVQSVVGNKA